MASYIGVSPPEQTGIIERYRYTGDGSTTVFSGNDVNGKQLRYTSTNPLLVFLNGVQLIEDIDFTKTSNTQVTFTTAPASNDDIEMMTFGSYDLQSPSTLRENMGLELSDGEIFVGSGSDLTSKVTPSGDATISNTGVVTVASAAGDFSVSCDLSLSDSSTAYFGDDNDLSVYHNGSTGYIAQTTGSLYIRNYANDQDIYLQSDDGSGGLTTYLTADGSTGQVQLNHYGNLKLTNGRIDLYENTFVDGDLTVDTNTLHVDSTNNRVGIGTTSPSTLLHLSSTDPKITITDTDGTGSQVIKADTDNLRMETPNIFQFQASNAGTIQLLDSTTYYGKIFRSGGFKIESVVADQDIFIRGNDGGVFFDALSFDMSEQGNATFNNNVSVGGNATITGNLTVNGTTTTINTATLDVEDLNITVACGAASAAAADGAGITVDGAAACLTYGSTCDAWSFNKGLGIGTTSPSNFVHIQKNDVSISGGLNGRNALLIEGDQGGHGVTLNLVTSTSANAYSGIFFGNATDTALFQIQGKVNGTGCDRKFYFYAPDGRYDFTNVGTTTVCFCGSNVGIGTGTPATKLHVEDGEITISDGTTCHQIGTNDSNLYFGNSALSSLTTGVCNVAVGCLALKDTTIGRNNTAFVHGALKSNTTGNYNVAIGSISQECSTSSQCNISIGYLSLRVNEGNDNVAIGVSALTTNTTGGCNIAIGKAALTDNTIGECNTAIGWGALSNNTTGNYNTSIGFYSMLCNTTGSQNLAIGRSSLRLNTTGTSNVAIGDSSLFSNTIGFANVAVGNSTLESQTGAVNGNIAIGHQAMRCNDAGLYNVAVGYQAMYNTNTSAGSYNTAHGYQALYNNTTGEKNTAIGYQSMYSNTTGEYNAAIGTDSLRSNTIGQQNVALGHNSLYCNTEGFGQVAAGYKSLFNNTTGCYNVGFGAYALECNTVGNCNVALGYEVLKCANSNYNVAIGYQAAKLVGGGFSNVYIGSQAGYGFDNPSNGQGCYNVAIGTSAALYITYGRYNTFLGNGAGATVVSGEQNVGIGSSTLSAIRDGDFNTALGYRALFASCNSSYNVAVGTRKSYDNTTGQYNVAMGYQALCGGTTASYNIAIGYESLLSNTTGEYNVALGYNTLKCATNSSVNIAIGNGALTYNSTGFYNIAIGQEAMGGCSTQCYFQENVAVGHCAGRFADGGLRNTFIGSGAGLNSSGVSYSVALGGGSGEHNTGSGVITIGRSAGRCNQGGNNIFIGTWAGYNNSGGNITGGNQVIIGAYSGCELTIGTDNVILGAYAANQTTTGSTNVVIGTAALASSVRNSRTVAIGYTALNAAMPQYACTTAVGWSAGQCNTGYENTFIGVEAGRNNLSASRNTALGMLTLCVNTYGEDNTVIRS